MKSTKIHLLLVSGLLLAACDKPAPVEVVAPGPQLSQQGDIDPVTGSPVSGTANGKPVSHGGLQIGEDVGRVPTVAFSSSASTMAFASLDDLTDAPNGYHPMSAHSPYVGMSFSGYIWHIDWKFYGPARSGVIKLFNAYGVDAEQISFANGVYYFSAWIGEPHGSPKQVWFEGWNGNTLVGTSAVIVANNASSQFLEVAFSSPVTRIRVRRGHGWWVMDDICYSSSATYDRSQCAPVPANVKPVANAGPDQSVALSGSPTALVQLDGGASSDDGQKQALTYTWSENGNTIATGKNASVTLGLGVHTIVLTVNDGEFSASDAVSITVSDPTPPVITSQISGDTGANGWYVSDVTVAWTVTDLESDLTSSGCSTSSVTTDTPGQSFTCSAQSAGGSDSKSVTVKLDKTKPVIAFSGNTGSYTVDQHITITCAASDAMSGVAAATCPGVNADAYTLALGSHTLQANASDNAGNGNSAQASFTVSATAASVCALVNRWVTNHGVANSMCVKLQHGSIRAFINEVNAQRGKKVSSAHADILIALAGAL